MDDQRTCSRASTVDRLPLAAAACSGVAPPSAARLGSAPAASSSSTTSWEPGRRTAAVRVTPSQHQILGSMARHHLMARPASAAAGMPALLNVCLVRQCSDETV